MINLSTPNDILVREIMNEKNKSYYWFVKQYGGVAKYEKMRDNLLADCLKQKKTCISDTFEYRSANGNRWMTYECARYFSVSHTAYTTPYSFCFYETLGSVGAFVPGKIGMEAEHGVDAVVIFTSHFFKQMCERLGIKYRSPEMMRKFHEFIPQFMLETYKDEEDENITKLIVRLPGSIGWGILRKGEGWVFEIRTFLMDTQLSNAQKRLTKNIREKAEKMVYEPKTIRELRIKNKIERGESIQEDIVDTINKVKDAGFEDNYIQEMMNVNLWIVTVISGLNIAKELDIAFWERFSLLNRNLIRDYVKRKDKESEDFLELLSGCIKNMGLRNYNKEEARKVYTKESQRVNTMLEQYKQF